MLGFPGALIFLSRHQEVAPARKTRAVALFQDQPHRTASRFFSDPTLKIFRLLIFSKNGLELPNKLISFG